MLFWNFVPYAQKLTLLNVFNFVFILKIAEDVEQVLLQPCQSPVWTGAQVIQ